MPSLNNTPPENVESTKVHSYGNSVAKKIVMLLSGIAFTGAGIFFLSVQPLGGIALLTAGIIFLKVFLHPPKHIVTVDDNTLSVRTNIGGETSFAREDIGHIEITTKDILFGGPGSLIVQDKEKTFVRAYDLNFAFNDLGLEKQLKRLNYPLQNNGIMHQIYPLSVSDDVPYTGPRVRIRGSSKSKIEYEHLMPIVLMELSWGNALNGTSVNKPFKYLERDTSWECRFRYPLHIKRLQQAFEFPSNLVFKERNGKNYILQVFPDGYSGITIEGS